MTRSALLVSVVLVPFAAFAVSARAVTVPRATGLYVLNEPANLRPAALAYPAGMFGDSTYLLRVTGHAIFVPIAKIVRPISAWGNFTYDWTYLDTLVLAATAHGKLFSIELETGLQTSGTTYTQALPANFAAHCGPDCAPEFNVWLAGGASAKCTSAYVPLPWVPNVQTFWSVTADSLAAHLHETGAYGSLTLVHVPGLSVYDEELRLPSGSPAPAASDTLPRCPDGRPPYPSAIDDESQARWDTLGYSDAATIAGFKIITQSFANAFPDRVIGLSLFPKGSGLGNAFPNFTADSAGYMDEQLVEAVAPLVQGRLEVQSDDLDSGLVSVNVLYLARQNEGAIGWQSNKHGTTGAGCGGTGSCLPDAPTGHYEQLLAYGAAEGAHYVEIWPQDVLTFPKGIATAVSAGLYSTASVPPAVAPPPPVELGRARPNPAAALTEIEYRLARATDVTLAVYDLLGRRVLAPERGERDAGVHVARFDTRGLRAGVYYARLDAAGVVKTRYFVVRR